MTNALLTMVAVVVYDGQGHADLTNKLQPSIACHGVTPKAAVEGFLFVLEGLPEWT